MAPGSILSSFSAISSSHAADCDSHLFSSFEPRHEASFFFVVEQLSPLLPRPSVNLFCQSIRAPSAVLHAFILSTSGASGGARRIFFLFFGETESTFSRFFSQGFLFSFQQALGALCLLLICQYSLPRGGVPPLFVVPSGAYRGAPFFWDSLSESVFFPLSSISLSPLLKSRRLMGILCLFSMTACKEVFA